MNRVLSILKDNLWTIAFTFVSTLYVFFFAINGYGITAERIWCSIAFFFIISVVCLLCDGWRKNVLMSIIAVVGFGPNIVAQSFLLMNHTILKSTDYWVIFDTNPAEAGGFFSGVPFNVFLFASLFTILLVTTLCLSIKKNKNSVVRIPKYIQYLATIILTICCLIQPFRTQVISIDFYKSFYKFNKEKIEVKEFYENRKSLKINCEILLPQSPKTFVFIIGESQNREHMSLYGYPRQTNPEMEKLKAELDIYTDVVSPAIQTLICMKEILTFTNYEQPDMYKKEASLIEILRGGGYKTFWIDNQGGSRGLYAIDIYTPTSYRTIAKMSDYYNDQFIGGFDSVVLPELKKSLQDTASNKFICLHIVGNHFDYESRYEKSFATFTNEPIVSKVKNQLTKEDKHIINCYDNATKYNDYIVSSVIQMLQEVDGLAAMIYISDHGEEVFDTQHYCSRSFEQISTPMCDIPFILWRNDAYRNANPLIIETDRQYCTDDIIHSLMNLAGVRYKLYDPTRDIFSKEFTPKERYVQGKRYDDIQ